MAPVGLPLGALTAGTVHEPSRTVVGGKPLRNTRWRHCGIGCGIGGGNARRSLEVGEAMGRIVMSLLYAREMLERMHAAPSVLDEQPPATAAVVDVA